MSQFSIEDLWRSAAGDGGSLPVDPRPSRLDLEELFQAWVIERGHTIECEILLNLSRATIARLMVTDLPHTASEDQATSDLIREIDHQLGNHPTNRT